MKIIIKWFKKQAKKRKINELYQQLADMINEYNIYKDLPFDSCKILLKILINDMNKTQEEIFSLEREVIDE